VDVDDKEKTAIHGAMRALQLQRNDALDKLAQMTGENSALRKDLQETQGRELKLKRELEAITKGASAQKTEVPISDEVESAPGTLQ
jgi:predicted nuclease with TOPRIM domain